MSQPRAVVAGNQGVRAVEWQREGGEMIGWFGQGPPEDDDEQLHRELKECADREWQRWGDDLRVNTERCLYQGDPEARDLIKAMIKPRIRTLVASIPAEHRVEATELLTWKAFQVLHDGFGKADHLGAYLIGALRNEVASIQRKISRDWIVDSLDAMPTPKREGLDADRQHGGRSRLPANDPIEALIHNEDILRRLGEFKTSAKGRRDRIGYKIGQVIEHCYLTGLNVTESCDSLEFSDSEARTIQQRISRERGQLNSPLHGLAKQVFDDVPLNRMLKNRRSRRLAGD